MDFTSFDRRGYPVVSVEKGYAEWANTYDATVEPTTVASKRGIFGPE
jgi:hypothetical protein